MWKEPRATKNWPQNIKTEARYTIILCKRKNLTRRTKVREQWATNELENYTKDANMKRTKNAANIKILRQSMRFLTLTSTTNNYYGS